MRKYQIYALLQFDSESSGNAAAGVEFNVYNASGGLADIYAQDGSSPISQTSPLVTDSNGRYEFYAANGRYSILFTDNTIASQNDLTDVSIYEYGSAGALDVATPAEAVAGTPGVIPDAAGVKAFVEESEKDYGFIVARHITNSTRPAGSRLMIKLPFSVDSQKMIKFNISQYSSFEQNEYEISGYLQQSINQWASPSFVYHGTDVPDVIFGYDSDNVAYVSIADNNYTGLTVHSVITGFNGTVDDSLNKNWTVIARDDVPNQASVDTVNQKAVAYAQDSLYAQNVKGESVASNAVIAGSDLNPAQSGSWRNISGISVSNNGYGQWSLFA